VLLQRLTVALGNYVVEQPVGVVLASRRHLLGPGRPGAVDLFVAATDEVRSLTWSRVRTLLLVAEVLSPFRRPGGPLPQAASLSRGPGTALLGL
jgi:hypothetical protein